MMGAVKGSFFMPIILVSVLNIKVTKLGGKWNNGAKCGTWYLNVNNTSSNRNRNISSHLLYVHIKIKRKSVLYTMTLIYISE